MMVNSGLSGELYIYYITGSSSNLLVFPMYLVAFRRPQRRSIVDGFVAGQDLVPARWHRMAPADLPMMVYKPSME